MGSQTEYAWRTSTITFGCGDTTSILLPPAMAQQLIAEHGTIEKLHAKDKQCPRCTFPVLSDKTGSGHLYTVGLGLALGAEADTPLEDAIHRLYRLIEAGRSFTYDGALAEIGNDVPMALFNHAWLHLIEQR